MARLLAILVALGVFDVAVAPRAHAGIARVPSIPARVIERLERDLQSKSSVKWVIAHCVRVYTIKTQNGKKFGYGMIILPGSGVAVIKGLEVDVVDPTKLKPGYYFAAESRMPMMPVYYYSSDPFMFSVLFNPTTGALISDD